MPENEHQFPNPMPPEIQEQLLNALEENDAMRRWIRAKLKSDKFGGMFTEDQLGEAVTRGLKEAERDGAAKGWERAHTILCSETQCHKHRNPYVRVQG